jgi:hypothetical protein
MGLAGRWGPRLSDYEGPCDDHRRPTSRTRHRPGQPESTVGPSYRRASSPWSGVDRRATGRAEGTRSSTLKSTFRLTVRRQNTPGGCSVAAVSNATMSTRPPRVLQEVALGLPRGKAGGAMSDGEQARRRAEELARRIPRRPSTRKPSNRQSSGSPRRTSVPETPICHLPASMSWRLKHTKTPPPTMSAMSRRTLRPLLSIEQHATRPTALPRWSSSASASGRRSDRRP